MQGWEDLTQTDIEELSYKRRRKKIKAVDESLPRININNQTDDEKPVKRKYKNVKTMIGNFKFDSKKEAEFYLKLKAKKAIGEIRWIKLQPEFLILRGFVSENGEKTSGVKYVADFEVEYADGRREVFDVKGVRTEAYKIKKKMLLNMYPNINFTEV